MPAAAPVVVEPHVLEMVGKGQVRAWALPMPLSGPRDVLVAADGTVWITEQNRSVLDSLHDGRLERHRVDEFPSESGAFSLAAAPDGSIWFSGYPEGSTGRVLPDGDANVFEALGPRSSTIGIAVAEDGTVWVADVARGALARLSTDGSADLLPVPGSAAAAPSPRDLAIAPDGTVWFTDPGTGSVGSVRDGDPPQVETYPVGNGTEPRSIALAPDGTPWFTLGNGKEIAHIDPADGSATIVSVPSATGKLNDLAVATDGTLWITEQGRDVLHVSADGSVIERYRLPAGAAYADGIALAPGGDVWVAATDANLVVQITP
jgi:virginiamycin B lyase